jgi:hypothetical protein
MSEMGDFSTVHRPAISESPTMKSDIALMHRRRAAAGYWVILGRHPEVMYPHPTSKILIFCKGGAMIERNISLPDMILWTGTRVALGAGIGMLISRRLTKDAMKAAGLALAIVGGFTTIPLAIAIMGKKDVTRPEIRSVA